VLLALAACVAFAGCGGDDEGAPIPTATATALNAELDGVQARIDQGSAGACRDILEGPRDPNKARAQELIDSMPDDVDSDVRSALQDSFDHLWDLVEQECDDKAQQEKGKQTQEPDKTTPETTPTETTPPETTPTETTPPETTPTETTPPDQAPLPPEGDGNNGGGIPGTGGGGGGVGPGAKAGKKEKSK
jgi:hypothetical protein